MNITPDELGAQYDRAAAQWPFFTTLEARYGLPPMLLFAIGSRETNLTDELGDGGHGHGVFQLDDRSHGIPDPYPVEMQAEDAAGHLAGDFARFGSWRAACDSYNSGQPTDAGTTGHDYGTDVLERCAWLQQHRTPPPPPEGDDMAAPKTADEINDWVREKVQELWDREITGTEQTFWAQYYAQHGEDLTEAAIYDHPNGVAFRARRGW